MRKTIIQTVLLLAATWCAAQQGSVQREDNAWTSVASGTLAGVHNLRIQIEAGGVEVEGSSGQGISYMIRNRSYEASEERAQRELQAYKVSAYVRGDGPLAGVSLEAALRCEPGHRMAGMLDTALQSGLRPEQIRGLTAIGLCAAPATSKAGRSCAERSI